MTEMSQAPQRASAAAQTALPSEPAPGVPLPPEVTTAVPERVLECAELGEQVLLAIDTALGSSVALGIGGRIFEVSHDDPRGHAEAIGTLIERVFAFSEAHPESVTGVVAGMGPGPFTGLRVGVAAAHAFAVGRGVPLLPLQSHEAVALAALEVGSSSGITGTRTGTSLRIIQDARRRELFISDYVGVDDDGIPYRVDGPKLLTRADYAEATGEVWPERIPAARLVQLAARRLSKRRDFETDRALYLRAPDVQPPKPGLLAALAPTSEASSNGTLG